jgi:beta-lactamase class A
LRACMLKKFAPFAEWGRAMSLQTKLTSLLQKIEGKISLVIEGGFSYEYHGDVVHPPASLIKLPVLAAALAQAEQGVLDLHEPVCIRPLSKAGGNGVIDSLSENTVLLAIDLLTLMITVSDNTATNWAIQKVGKQTIQEEMQRLGLCSTELNRYMMQSPEEAGGDNMTTARDMVKLLQAMDVAPLRNAFYKPLLEQQFRFHLPGVLEYVTDVEIANKTGGVRGVVHDVARFRSKQGMLYAALLMSEVEDTSYASYIHAQIGKVLADYLLENI